MKGVCWSIALAGAGVLLALIGLVTGSDLLMAYGAGAIATVVVGWPVLLVMGAVQTSARQ